MALETESKTLINAKADVDLFRFLFVDFFPAFFFLQNVLGWV